MSRSLAWCLAGALACVLVGLWGTSLRRARSERDAVGTAEVERERERAVAELDAPTLASDPAAGLRREERASSSAEESRAAAPGAARATELVAGVVVLPPGFPPEEEAWVTFGARVPVARDGSFELRAPAGMEIRLGLESRMLWLGFPVRVRPGERAVLEPFLGAVLEVTLEPPLALLADDHAWAEMEVAWERVRSGGPDEAWSPTEGKAVVPEGERVELARLLPGVGLRLHVANPFGPDLLRELEPFAPGEVRTLALVLETGKTVAGVVLDEHDQPVAGARLALGPEELVERPWNRWTRAAPLADAEGRFRVAEVERGVAFLRTDDPQLLRQGEADIEGPGDRYDVVLRVARGGRIEGRARWPDGAPVEEFQALAQGPRVRGTTGKAGVFGIAGLAPGRYRLELRAERDGVLGTAELEVETDGAPLEVVLENTTTLELRGTVVDAEGQPIPAFRVRASQVGKSIAREATEGRFAIPGFSPGEWSVTVWAEGHAYVDQRVELPMPASQELRFVLPATQRIRGQVLDAASRPVASAWVGDEREASVARQWAPEEQRTDASGRFDIELSWPSGRLVAQANGHAPSEPVPYGTERDEASHDVVLRLREACRVAGRVLDERGQPMPGLVVFAPSLFPLRIDATSDAEGRFALEGLPPGPAQLMTSDPERGARLTASLVLAPGEEATCELRVPARDPVRVSGRLTRAGRPLAARLSWTSAGYYRDCESGADGGFELELQTPGAWAVRVAAPDAPRAWRSGRLDVPDVEEHALALEFDALAAPSPPAAPR
jgi:carboxypeptidase family protein